MNARSKKVNARPANDARKRPTPSRRPMRKWLIVGGLIFVCLGAFPAWRNVSGMMHLSTARRALDNEEHQQAVDALLAAKRVMPNSMEVEFLLAVVHRRLGQMKKSRTHLDRAVELGAVGIEVRREELLHQARTGQFTQIAGEMKNLAGLTEDTRAAAETYQALAVGYWWSNHPWQALECLEECITRRPDDLQSRILKVELLLEIGEVDEMQKAVAECKKMLEIEPANTEVSLVLAETWLELGDVDAAIKQFEHNLDQGDAGARVLLGVAECHRRLGNVDQSQEYLDRIGVDRLPPRLQARAYKAIGQVALFRNQRSQAVDALKKAAAAWPHDAQLHHLLSQAYSGLGKQALAEKHRALNRDVNARSEQMTKALLRLEIEPDNPNLHYSIGKLMAGLGQENDAAGWYQSALQCDPAHQPSRQALAEQSKNKD